MKKLLLLMGVVVGFVLGSKGGREPYERLEAQVRRLAGRPEVQGAIDSATSKAADLTHTVTGTVNEKISNVTDTMRQTAGPSRGPIGSIDQAEIDAETDAALVEELEGTFPTSDSPSSWAGPDLEAEGPDDSLSL
jgi:hypothetical protein